MPRFRVARVLGIPIYVDASWFLLFGFVTFLLASEIYPDFMPERSRQLHVLLAGISALIFFGSILLHELAHSVVAKLYKIPVKSITLFLFGGVAQITREATRPSGELLMAAAGPVMSLLIGAAFIGPWIMFELSEETPVGAVVIWIGIMNIVLGVFNLIPAFPMDGGRVFRSLAWMVTRNYHLATRIAGWTGRGIAWAMIALGALTAFGVDTKVVADGTFGALWFMFIGFYLESAARQGLTQNKLIETLAKYRAQDLMVADPPVVDAQMSIAALARGVIDINPGVTYFVEEEGVLAGILSGYQMRAVPEPQWESTTASQAMLPSGKLKAVAPDRLANEILIDMETADLSHLPVVSDGRVLGVVGRDRIIRVLQKSGLIA